MTDRRNEFGQPIGPDVPGWQGAATPDRSPMEGRFCRLSPVDPDGMTDALFDAFRRDEQGALWTYMSTGPFATRDDIRDWLQGIAPSEDPFFFAITDQKSGQAVGVASYLRIAPAAGSIEVGNISFSPLLQRTPMATEAMFLMMSRAFDDWGYRRYEWKCDALNAASRRAAARFGFSYEGLFRQALVYKGRNRDTAWYAIIDRDWPALKRAYEAWLNPGNFDAEGQQLSGLRDLIAEAGHKAEPG